MRQRTRSIAPGKERVFHSTEKQEEHRAAAEVKREEERERERERSEIRRGQ